MPLASAAAQYHIQQREASFVRDKVRPEEPTRWTEAKLREIFLVPVYSCPTEIRVGEWGEGGKVRTPMLCSPALSTTLLCQKVLHQA